MKITIRLINLGGENSDKTGSRIKEIIRTQWRDDAVIEGSGEGSADYDAAIIFGGEHEKPIGITKDGKKIEGVNLDDLVEQVIQAGLAQKIQSRLARKPQ